eukprot:jgi/Picsp_1/5480/NSC_02839-R1_glutaredoxin type i
MSIRLAIPGMVARAQIRTKGLSSLCSQPVQLRSVFQPSHIPRSAISSKRWVQVKASGGSADLVKSKNQENPVMVYSKTYCPYCSQVKSLFTKLNVPAKVVELDQLEDGDDVQSALQEVSGMRTVPQVFVGGKLVGGCDDTLAAYKSGSLGSMLSEVGLTVQE